MKTGFLLLLLLALSVTAFSQSEDRKSRIRRDIVAVMNAQADAWNRGDIEGFMTGYWRSDKLLFISGDEVTRGWQTTLDRYKRTYNSREKMGTLRFSDLEIDVISKTAAIVLGSWALTRAGDSPKGKFTLLFRKLDGRWLIVRDHTS